MDTTGDSGYVTAWSEAFTILGKLECLRNLSQTPGIHHCKRGPWWSWNVDPPQNTCEVGIHFPVFFLSKPIHSHCHALEPNSSTHVSERPPKISVRREAEWRWRYDPV